MSVCKGEVSLTEKEEICGELRQVCGFDNSLFFFLEGAGVAGI